MTKMTKSIHKNWLYCCKDYHYLNNRTLFLMDYEWSYEEMNRRQAEEDIIYGIAWATEGDSPIQGNMER